MRYDIYDLHSPPVEPLIPRSDRIEVVERMDPFGEVLTPLQAEGLKPVEAFLQNTKPAAVAVTFLHSYRNPRT